MVLYDTISMNWRIPEKALTNAHFGSAHMFFDPKNVYSLDSICEEEEEEEEEEEAPGSSP